jgi:hypothetical protein
MLINIITYTEGIIINKVEYFKLHPENESLYLFTNHVNKHD